MGVIFFFNLFAKKVLFLYLNTFYFTSIRSYCARGNTLLYVKTTSSLCTSACKGNSTQLCGDNTNLHSVFSAKGFCLSYFINFEISIFNFNTQNKFFKDLVIRFNKSLKLNTCKHPTLVKISPLSF